MPRMLLFTIFLLRILTIFCQLTCKKEAKESLLVKLYVQELASNDGTGELREFVCALDEQNLVMEEAFLPKQQVVQNLVRQNKKINSDSDENLQKNSLLLNETALLKQKWQIFKLKDASLAETFITLRTAFSEIIFSGRKMLEELKKNIVKATFLLADRMQIPRDQIIPIKQKINSLVLLKQVAKLWANIKFNGKRKDKRNYNQKSGKNNKEHFRNSHQNERKIILNLILTAVDDGNILALNSATKGNGDGLSSGRRRRKKRAMAFAIVLIAAVIILRLITFSVLHFCASGEDDHHNGDIAIHAYRRPTEIRIKLRYGDDELDLQGNNKSDHAYIVVGNKVRFHGEGARVRENHICKSCPTKTFSFTPKLDAQGDITRIEDILNEMHNGKWHAQSHNYTFHSCIDFAYQFVCRLNNGVCPEKKRWPKEFVEFDQRWVHRESQNGRFSVFDWHYATSEQNCEQLLDALPVAISPPQPQQMPERGAVSRKWRQPTNSMDEYN